jgi:hypothetical protein
MYPPTEASALHLPSWRFVHLAGVTFYQPALRLLIASHPKAVYRDAGEPESVVAVLLAEADNEHDPNAVAVLIDRRPVGHLPRDEAAVYRPWLLAGGGMLSCPASFAGGTTAKPTIGCRVELPTPPKKPRAKKG